MKTLDEHNQERSANYEPMNSDSKLAGVLCNKCEVEMVLFFPDSILASFPPKIVVHCRKCNVVGYKVVY